MKFTLLSEIGINTVLADDEAAGKAVNQSLENLRRACDSLHKLLLSCPDKLLAIKELLIQVNQMRAAGTATLTTVNIVVKLVRVTTAGIGQASVSYSDDILKLLGLVTGGALRGARLVGQILAAAFTAAGIVIDTVIIGFAIHQLVTGSDTDFVKQIRNIKNDLETSFKDFEKGCKPLLES